MSRLPTILASITMLSHESGGRVVAPDLNSPAAYMPHLVIQSVDTRVATVINGNQIIDEYLGVRFISGPLNVVRDEPFESTFELMYYPVVDYDAVQVGATFTIREGAKILGFGSVLRRSN